MFYPHVGPGGGRSPGRGPLAAPCGRALHMVMTAAATDQAPATRARRRQISLRRRPFQHERLRPAAATRDRAARAASPSNVSRAPRPRQALVRRQQGRIPNAKRRRRRRAHSTQRAREAGNCSRGRRLWLGRRWRHLEETLLVNSVAAGSDTAQANGCRRAASALRARPPLSSRLHHVLAKQ